MKSDLSKATQQKKKRAGCWDPRLWDRSTWGFLLVLENPAPARPPLEALGILLGCVGYLLPQLVGLLLWLAQAQVQDPALAGSPTTQWDRSKTLAWPGKASQAPEVQ